MSPYQNAFIKHSQISKNSIIVKEIMSNLHRKKGVKGCIALKIDLHNPFNQLEWDFIIRILKKLGFSKKMVQSYL